MNALQHNEMATDAFLANHNINLRLRAWVMRKFKRFKHRTIQASRFLQRLAEERVDLFVHWRIALAGTFE
jgi:RNA-directed DNA polymerase